MASRRTWVWVVVGGCGVVLVGLIGVAGAGVYFVTRHITTERSSSAEALQAFDAVRTSFAGAKPLYELDNSERPILARRLSDLPTSSARPDHLWVLAWDPAEERLIKVAMPFWILRLHKTKMAFGPDDRGFGLEHLDLDADELARIGPALVFDFRDDGGVRVLLWTQ